MTICLLAQFGSAQHVGETFFLAKMCVRHVYRCRDCDRMMAIPKRLPLVFALCGPWLQRRGPSRVDRICNNRHCLRRYDSGYSACLSMRMDACYFCVRYGHERLCYNLMIPVVCKNCHKKSTSERYPGPGTDYRMESKMMDDFLESAVEAVARNP